jgi:hypothetical protein
LVEGTAGKLAALTPFGALWKGTVGKEIYITNFNDPVEIGNIQQHRSEINANHRDDNWVVYGMPNSNTPLVNLYGLKISGVISWSHAPGGGNNTEAAYIHMDSYGIGFHWKPNTTPDKGDRRAHLNKFGWDMNMSRQFIHDCFIHSDTGEGVYLGGGGYYGQTVKVMHYNSDGSKKMVLSNGVSVHEFHNVRRFNSFHTYVRIENNIFDRNGWDSFQTRNVIDHQLIRFNYVFMTAQDPNVFGGQSECMIFGDTVGEISYNFGEKGYQTGLRANMLGRDNVHHNIIVWIGHDDDFPSTNLPINGGGIAIYAGNAGTIIDDVPQNWIADHPTWNPDTPYQFDSYQVSPTDRGIKVKKNGVSYRSLQPNNLDHDPETSPLWWENTREGDSYVARPELTIGELYFYCLHNTFVECNKNTVQNFLAFPKNQTYWYNNFWVNCKTTVLNFGTGANHGGNVALNGVVVDTYFESDADRDYRLLNHVTTKWTGVNIDNLVTARPDAFAGEIKNLDFCGVVHHNPPSLGAIEFGSAKNDHYLWVAHPTSGPVIPPPINIEAGAPVTMNLPQNSVTITAVPSDNTRVLNTILWTQVSGPAANLLNEDELTVTINDLQQGVSVFQIQVIDEYGQVSNDSITITVNQVGIVNRVTIQWYTVTDVNKSNKTAIANSNELNINKTPYVGTGLYLLREIRPVSTSGLLIGNTVDSNVFGPL